MSSSRRVRALSALTTFAAVAASMALPAGAATAATGPRGPGSTERNVGATFEKHPFFTYEYGLNHPAAATFVDGAGVLAVAQRANAGATVALLRPDREKVVGRMTVPGLTDPTTLADDGHGTLAALDGQTLLTWPASARGEASVQRHAVQGQSLADAAGMTFDPATGNWLVLDGTRQQIVELAQQGSTLQATDGPTLDGLGASSLQGIAMETSSGLVYVADPDASRLYAVDSTGTTQQTLDAGALDGGSLGSLAFGPTADPTDSSTASSLYATQSGGTSSYGLVSEMSLAPVTAAATAAPTTSTGSLVRMTDTSKLDPSAPDPAGIVYMADQQRLMISDSEVDETVAGITLYAGVNLWQLSRDAKTQYATGNTLKFSHEPTGLGYDPIGKRLFITDDDLGKVFQVLAGSDNLFGTPDDAVTPFSATAFGDDDAEDVAYDTKTGDLFVSQGVGAEVYRVSPGANGRFDGVAPAGDDQVTHFDVGVLGITDGEALGYSPTRDTLFMTDPNSGKIIEFTKDGALLQTIDVSALGMVNPADITLAPATNDPTRTDMYVVTRGIDNNDNPNENDGKMYEISAPDLGPTGTQTNSAPKVSAGVDQSVTLPSSTILKGTASDDGLPNPPGFTTETWSKVSGPGTVTFGDAKAASTTASFTTAGTYVLRLTASDSALTSADEVTVTVNPQSTTNTAPSVFAGADQAITLPGSASLHGTVSDDGLPNPPGVTTTTWSKVSGPGNVSFSSPGSTSTLASFTVDGTYVLRLTADDSALTSSDDITVVVQPAPATGNLVKNPGFEVDTTGWKPSLNSGTLTRVASPHTGSWSGQMDNPGTTTVRCTLTDSPNWVGTTQPGSYTVSTWVKGDTAGAGATVSLLAREYDKSSNALVNSQQVSVKLTTEWQKLELSYVPVSPGSTTLDVSVERAQTPAGATCFLADDVFVGTVQQNSAPVVGAGPDLSVTLPNPATLNGTVSDDGLPNPPATVTATWSKFSGPGTVSFADASKAATTATFGAAGTYVLRLTAYDGSLTTTDDVTVTVNPAPKQNTAPVVGAGPDLSVTLPNPATLNGTVSDDGLPNPPATVTATWSKFSGPGTVSFADASKAATTATFGAAGTYVLRLTAYDGSLTTTDDVTVTVNPAPKQNTAPVVGAGPDLSVTLPNPATLNGTVSDDGLPNPPATVTATWSKFSGPGTVSFADASKAATTATFTAAGDYVLRLTAYDGSLTTTDEVKVTAQATDTGTGGTGTGGGGGAGGGGTGGGAGGGTPAPSNTAPTVSAGADATVQLRDTAALNGTVSDDGLPSGTLATKWSKVSGPGTVTFGDAEKVDTTARFSAAGDYLLQLRADDGALTATDDVRITVRTEATGPAPALSVRVLDRRVMVGDQARFTGSVGPVVAGQVVRLQRWNGKAWVGVHSTALAGGETVGFSLTATSSRSRVVRYRVRVPAFAGSPAATVSNLKVGYYTARIVRISAKHEWVKVRNTGDVTFDLDGWTLTNRRNGKVLVLAPMRLRPGQAIRIHAGSGHSERRDVFLGGGPMWGRHGLAVLRDDVRQRADRFRY